MALEISAMAVPRLLINTILKQLHNSYLLSLCCKPGWVLNTLHGWLYLILPKTLFTNEDTGSWRHWVGCWSFKPIKLQSWGLSLNPLWKLHSYLLLATILFCLYKLWVIALPPRFQNPVLLPWPVWLSWLEHHPIHQKVTDLIPRQSTCLDCGFRPCSGINV